MSGKFEPKPRLAPEPYSVKGSLWIPLTKDKFALVNDFNYPILLLASWHFDSTGYAAAAIKIDGKEKIVRMHRLVINAPKGVQVDHINGDKLDNRVENLRLATNTENGYNRGIPRNNTSGYKGVYLDKRRNKWFAQIKINDKNKFLGYFDDPIEAALAYDKVASELHGKFARLNFPNG